MKLHLDRNLRSLSLSATDGSAGEGAGGGGGDAAAAAAAAQAAGGGGDEPAKAFYEAFADANLKTDPTIQKFKDPEALAASYLNLQKMVGAKPEQILKLPEKMDDPEAMRAIWQKLGGPEKVDGYKVDLTKATDADKAAIGGYLDAMHKAGPFPPGMVEASVKWFQDQVAAQQTGLLEEAKRMDDAGQAELKKEWGQAYDQRSGEVGKLLKDLGGDDLAKELNGSVFGSNPKLAIFLAKVVDKMAEGGPNADPNKGDLQTGKMTPAQAQAKARELEAHPAFRDRSHAQHADVTQQRNDALRMAQG